MEYLGDVAILAGGALLAIGYINDASVGADTYGDSGEETLTAYTAASKTVADVRKTDATSNTLKVLGGIMLAAGAGLNAWKSYSATKSASL